MPSSGLLCIKWNNHASAFDKLLNNLHLKDVYSDGTIVCYGKFYPVHQFVLSTYSEYFDEIFRHSTNMKSKHPFIIVKDIQPPQMEALLNYMYRGEVNIPQEMLPELIKAAEAFKIKGIAVPDDEPAPSKLSSSRERKRSNANLSSPSSQIKKSRRVKESSESDKISSKNDYDGKQCEELQTECSGSSSQKEPEELYISEISPNEVKLEPVYVLDPEYNETKEISDKSAPPEDNYILPREIGIKEEEEKSFDSDLTTEPIPPHEDEENLPTEDQYDLSQTSSWENSQGFEESNLEKDSTEGMGIPVIWISSDNNKESGNAGGVTDFVANTQPVIKEKKFKCTFSLCPYQSNSKPKVDKHFLRHAGDRPFLCHLCHFMTSRKEHLKRHLLIHSGEKPFQCGQCAYRCFRKESLNTHLIIHSGVKPFHCDQCSYRCSQSAHLKNHLLIHSSEKSFSCPHCPYKAAQKQGLSQHMKKHI